MNKKQPLIFDMDILLYLLAICLILFGLLGFIDGFYLHIWRFRLYAQPESRFEHLTHTARAILFPLIAFFLFLYPNEPGYYQWGLLLVLIDLVVLMADAWSEKDSRAFMGGLPRWEYILHLLVNGFHFGAIILFFGLKFSVEPGGMITRDIILNTPAGTFLHLVVVNILPGALAVALLHLLTVIPATRKWWDTNRQLLACC